MPGVFLSYRRSDTQEIAGRIFDRLADQFSRFAVFKDVDSIPLGVRFPTYVEDAVRDSDVVLVLIGPTWVRSLDADGQPRLHDPQDLVRREVETALSSEIPTVPLMIANAAMPTRAELPQTLQPLVERNGLKIRPDPDFHRDLDRLIQHLIPMLKTPSKATGPPLNRDFLLQLLELTQGWYNDIIQTAAQVATAGGPQEATRFQMLYLHTRQYLPRIVAIRNLIPPEGDGLFLAKGIDQFLQLLTYSPNDSALQNSMACRHEVLDWSYLMPHLTSRMDVPSPLVAIQTALQEISNEITRLLSIADAKSSERL